MAGMVTSVSSMFNSPSRSIDPGTTQRLYLRALSSQDATIAYLSWLNDSVINRFLHLDSLPETTDELSAYIERINSSPTDFLFGVFDAPSHVHVGNIKIGEINWRHSFAEIGVLIGERGFQNLGYATDALQLTIDLAFREFELHKLIAGIHESNENSIRLFEKQGFRLEGIRRKQFIDRAGVRFDGLLYGLFNPRCI